MATNTIENSEQPRRWVKRLDYGSLIVVTSAYHMPRSMAELGHAMPGVTLLPHAVVREDLGLDRWYNKPSTVRLVIAEYAKFVLARFRLCFDMTASAQPTDMPGPLFGSSMSAGEL
ncbi:MAG: YdcF family protein [Pseudomonadota bacterium]